MKSIEPIPRNPGTSPPINSDSRQPPLASSNVSVTQCPLGAESCVSSARCVVSAVCPSSEHKGACAWACARAMPPSSGGGSRSKQQLPSTEPRSDAPRGAHDSTRITFLTTQEMAQGQTAPPLADKQRELQPSPSTEGDGGRDAGARNLVADDATAPRQVDPPPLDAPGASLQASAAHATRGPSTTPATAVLPDLIDDSRTLANLSDRAVPHGASTSQNLSQVLLSVKQQLNGRATTDADVALVAVLLQRGDAPRDIVQLLCMELRDKAEVLRRLIDLTSGSPPQQNAPLPHGASATCSRPAAAPLQEVQVLSLGEENQGLRRCSPQRVGPHHGLG